MKIVLTDEQINNLFIFLDRVEIKGFKELQAFNEILAVFQKNKEEPEDKWGDLIAYWRFLRCGKNSMVYR